ncbi:MAG TPA: hypothetical protein VJW20_07955 [Candidatus Angelobacter sp.]|nr:hypothetical protein [Candidatus Angelobacter sp.]
MAHLRLPLFVPATLLCAALSLLVSAARLRAQIPAPPPTLAQLRAQLDEQLAQAGIAPEIAGAIRTIFNEVPDATTQVNCLQWAVSSFANMRHQAEFNDREQEALLGDALLMAANYSLASYENPFLPDDPYKRLADPGAVHRRSTANAIATIMLAEQAEARKHNSSVVLHDREYWLKQLLSASSLGPQYRNIFNDAIIARNTWGKPGPDGPIFREEPHAMLSPMISTYPKLMPLVKNMALILTNLPEFQETQNLRKSNAAMLAEYLYRGLTREDALVNDPNRNGPVPREPGSLPELLSKYVAVEARLSPGRNSRN